MLYIEVTVTPIPNATNPADLLAKALLKHKHGMMLAMNHICHAPPPY